MRKKIEQYLSKSPWYEDRKYVLYLWKKILFIIWKNGNIIIKLIQVCSNWDPGASSGDITGDNMKAMAQSRPISLEGRGVKNFEPCKVENIQNYNFYSLQKKLIIFLMVSSHHYVH